MPRRLHTEEARDITKLAWRRESDEILLAYREHGKNSDIPNIRVDKTISSALKTHRQNGETYEIATKKSLDLLLRSGVATLVHTYTIEPQIPGVRMPTSESIFTITFGWLLRFNNPGHLEDNLNLIDAYTRNVGVIKKMKIIQSGLHRKEDFSFDLNDGLLYHKEEPLNQKFNLLTKQGKLLKLHMLLYKNELVSYPVIAELLGDNVTEINIGLLAVNIRDSREKLIKKLPEKLRKPFKSMFSTVKGKGYKSLV